LFGFEDFMNRKLVLMAILSFSVGAGLSQTPSRTSVSIVAGINRMQPAVVQIRYASDASAPEFKQGIAGTGFFINEEGYVITAGHVIVEAEALLKANGASKITFEIAVSLDTSSPANVRMRGVFSGYDCSVVELDRAHDVALLKTRTNPFKNLSGSGIQIGGKELKLKIGTAKLKPILPPSGESALVSGYPLFIPTLVTQGGIVASETYAESRWQPSGAVAGSIEIEDLILLDAMVNPGNSGGPVYFAESGYVFGICQGYRNSPVSTGRGALGVLTQNSGLAVVIPIKYAIALLEKNEVGRSLIDSPGGSSHE
jgi:S1-C subfamily serine protease